MKSRELMFLQTYIHFVLINILNIVSFQIYMNGKNIYFRQVNLTIPNSLHSCFVARPRTRTGALAPKGLIVFARSSIGRLKAIAAPKTWTPEIESTVQHELGKLFFHIIQHLKLQ